MYFFKVTILLGVFTLCVCEITEEKKSKLLSDFIKYYNLQPNQSPKASEGYLRTIEEIDPTTYKIDISFTVQNNGPKLMQCTAMIQDLGDMGIAIVNYDMHCGDLQQKPSEEAGEVSETSIEVSRETGPVKLENEVERDTLRLATSPPSVWTGVTEVRVWPQLMDSDGEKITSGEQFIAIPRNKPKISCEGCASHVNPQAEGVKDLANLGVRHLDLHEPSIKHSLDTVIDVERQVQVINGVRYILTLSIIFNNCTDAITDACSFTNVCKISILVKPWQILPNGSKYKAILSNNCTEQWQFGDNGEVLPELPDNHNQNEKSDHSVRNSDDKNDDIINAEHLEEVHSQPHQEKTLSNDEIAAIEEQIIPNDNGGIYFKQNENVNVSPNVNEERKTNIISIETGQQSSVNVLPVTESSTHETSNLSQDKKKVIDDMLDFFNFAGFETTTEPKKIVSREKRSFEYDLQLLSLVKNYKELKRSIDNAKYIYEMAQKMIDYLNEIDMVVKNRAIQNVIKAEEEDDNDKHFVYIQAQVIIPCDTANCAYKETETRICNGVIDSSNKTDPQVLNSFCYSDSKNIRAVDKIHEVSLDDLVLLRLANRVLFKMESEYKGIDALNINRILSANTRLASSGRLTQISMIIEHLDCNKSLSLVLRRNCSVKEYLGHSICEVVVHEKDGLKDIKMDYSCTELHTGMTISKISNGKITEDDPRIIEILQEALQYLETQSNSQYKQKLININNITTQIIAGFLIEIEFTVGYTNCTDDSYLNIKSNHCVLLKNDRLRTCNAQVFDRSWIIDGKQMQVSCKVLKESKGSKSRGQLWPNKKNINLFDYVKNQRVKRDALLGGKMNQDPKDPTYIRLAEESIQKYLISNGISKPHKIVRINSVTTQVVSGILTNISFLVTTKDSDNGDILNCFSTVWERLWFVNGRDISVSCSIENQRTKRSLFVGGKMEQDPNDPKYISLANEAMQKYLTSNAISQPHRIVRVDKVTTQVVAGTMTYINFLVTPTDHANGNLLNCFSKIQEQPWFGRKDIDVSCQKHVSCKVLKESKGSKSRGQLWPNKKNINLFDYVKNQRVKRDALLGGKMNQDPKDPTYIRLAEESIQKYLISNGISKPHKIVRINSVTTQVVSGILTNISFLVTTKDSDNGDILNCFSTVWERLWFVNGRDISVSCSIENQRTKRSLFVGGKMEQDPNDPKYISLANEAMQKYLTSNAISQPHRIVRVDKVTTQVVAGTMTYINFLVTPTDHANGNLLNCFSKIQEQPWFGRKDIDVSCQKHDKNWKTKQLQISTLHNPITQQNASDPKYLQLAKESLEKFLLDTGNKQFHKVIKVEKVTTQIVSGTLTRLNFIVLPIDATKSDIINCYSEIWEQTWLFKRNVTVSCQLHNQNLKTQLPGLITIENPNETKFLLLAEESLKKYVSDTGIQQPLKVFRIEKVTTQFVEGFLIKMEFTVSGVDNITGFINCISEIWGQDLQVPKKIKTICENDAFKLRRKRILLPNKNHNKYPHHNKNIEEEQDVNKPEFKLLASQALQKFSKRIGVLHKVVEISEVTTRVVAGIIYKIHFSASPTKCLFNTTGLRARRCKVIENTTLYCYSEIWDQPWIKMKRITIRCSNPDETDYDEGPEEEEEPNLNTQPSQKLEDSKIDTLAEEALEQYLSFTKRKYVYRITQIHNSYEHIADGKINKIDFSIAPTVCLRNGFIGTINTCTFKMPKVEYRCNTEIIEQLWLKNGKDIKINCKKVESLPTNQTLAVKRSKRQLEVEHKDQEDNEINEDAAYYYAEKAVQHVNDAADTNNLHKLITVHAIQTSVQMKTTVVKMYIEIAETYCLRHQQDIDLNYCEEMEGLNHRLCFARIYPSPDDEMIIRHVAVVCDDNDNEFDSVTGLNIAELVRLSIEQLELEPENRFKLVHQGEPLVIPSLDTTKPIKLNFIVATTNCTKDVKLNKNPFQCYLDTTVPAKSCVSFIRLETQTRTIHKIDVACRPESPRVIRSHMGGINATANNSEINDLVSAALQKLEMSSLYRYKLRVLHINSYSSKITSGKTTTIDFDVGYTSCLKYEWVDNVTRCDILEHLPRRHCVARILERLWVNNGKNIEVTCEDDETPLEAHVEFESTDLAMLLAQEALKHIEAKYPHPKKQKVIRTFSLEKQVVAGIHYRMKIEVGLTDCPALSEETNCKLDEDAMNKFCRVNVWIRPWTDHPPNIRVFCDFQEGNSVDLYYQIQAENLFFNFLATYNPNYVNDHSELEKRFEIFKKHIRIIHELNVHEKGTAKYGITRFADLTYKEFSSRYMGLKKSLQNKNFLSMKTADIPNVKMPQSFDWRNYEAVTEVKDQGSCGSSWAFSVIGNIEGLWKLQSGKLESFSEQVLMDCDKLNEGCKGGLPENAYRTIKELGGLQLERDYPYKGEEDKCLFNSSLAKAHITGAVNITSNETGMAQWLVKNGPITVGINGRAMQFYTGGIAYPWSTFSNSSDLDHSVLIVGYGIEEYPQLHKKLPYWIVKNSWGISWGEQGYYRVYRGDGTCGVNQMASSAVI